MRALVRSSHPPQSNAVSTVRSGADPRDLLRFKRAQFGHVMDSSALRMGPSSCAIQIANASLAWASKARFLAKLQA